MRKFDSLYRTGSVSYLAGIDEAGRGPLAGPVVAAAVIFDGECRINGIRDSKALTLDQREKLYTRITERCVCYGVGIVDHDEIDRINILNASLLAMKIAVDKLSVKPHLMLIDGNKRFFSTIPAKTVVKGDAKSFSIAAASIIAKVTRDRMMVQASREYPGFGWERNAGYATKEHISAILEKGLTPLHRKTFVRKILASPQEELAFPEG